MTEIAVVTVIGIHHYLFHHDFRIYHDNFQRVLARGKPLKGGVEPTEVVKHLITARQLATLPETAQGQPATWGQRFEYLRTGNILMVIL